jgi:hypothetical protein
LESTAQTLTLTTNDTTSGEATVTYTVVCNVSLAPLTQIPSLAGLGKVLLAALLLALGLGAIGFQRRTV